MQIKGHCLHLPSRSTVQYVKKTCWKRRMLFCFTELKLSVFISALMQTKQANPIQSKINFLAVMAHGTKQRVKTRKTKGRKGDQVSHSTLVRTLRLVAAQKLRKARIIYLSLQSFLTSSDEITSHL